jgi:hypothetical protein
LIRSTQIDRVSHVAVCGKMTPLFVHVPLILPPCHGHCEPGDDHWTFKYPHDPWISGKPVSEGLVASILKRFIAVPHEGWRTPDISKLIWYCIGNVAVPIVLPEPSRTKGLDVAQDSIVAPESPPRPDCANESQGRQNSTHTCVIIQPRIALSTADP